MLSSNSTTLIMIDVQDKLTNMLPEVNAQNVSKKALSIIKSADILNIKTIITEQYPKGLGATIEPIREYLGKKYTPFEKTSFSIVKDEKIFNEIKSSNNKQIVLFGIEAHICVFQSALELKEMGYDVYVVSDISYSRDDIEKELALKTLRHNGIQTVSLEMVLFMWLEGAKHPNFKEIQAFIK